MRIAIIGAHRVGKTTLAEKLCEHLPGYKLYREPYYELEDTGYLFSESPDIDDFITQFDFSVKQIPESEDDVIFDRCPIDLLAYIHAMDKNKNIQHYYKKVQELSSEIDLLVFVPIENPDRIGCEKSDLPKLRYKVNEILSEWIWDFDIMTIEVNGTLPSRIRQLLSKTV
ncbi:AAA family ATPase [Flavobacterium cerinum]|uniref:ATP-binding protein n=1 Tax=Flavobacterium cerinum TaxID=2502784 RepID=A0ABY5J139_9FLAO|nr:AAA family ATPase [Flavobacterium cerinum]UUC47284.1 ATP-binding protein [Flavobacterium cerinum]